MKKSSSIQNLKTTGVVSVAYPPELRGAVERANVSWKKFCELPLETKMTLKHSNSGAGFGYEPKREKGDNKENFDLTTSAEKALLDWAKGLKDRVALDFVNDVLALVPLIKPIAVDFAARCEKEFGLADFTQEIENSADRFFIRFIHYFPGSKVGEETAEAHPDQSGFTLHLFEDAPGLQYLPYNGGWTDMPVSAGETVIIPDMQMQLRSRGELRALYHRVIATPETSRDGRFSAVCFVQFKNTPKYDKDTHGPLQESRGKFKRGFNYTMPFGEFSKLFKN